MQINKDLFLTEEGLLKLKAELKDLIDIKRPEIARKIQEAREFGDLSENAAYDTARQEQAFTEGRIKELEDILKNAVVSESKNNDKVSIGSTVKMHLDGEEVFFHIVGAPEADPTAGKISHESPLGQTLLGKKVGDHVEFEAPVGKLTYKILSID